MRAIRYSLEEAVTELWRNGRSTLLSVLTIGSALFVTGVFLLISSNLSRLVESWSSAAEMSVYLTDTAGAVERKDIEAALAASPVIEAIEFVGKDEALARIKRDFDDLASVASTLHDNPLPASYDVRISSAAGQGAALDALAATLDALPGVSDVRYDGGLLDRLMMSVAVVRGVVTSFAVILVLTASLTVANVVRLSCHARRDELEIMQLVGAPMAFVQGPFVAEGVLLGGIGSVFALAILWSAFRWASFQYGQMTTGFGLMPFDFLPPPLVVGLLVGGPLVGCLGGLIGVRGTRRRPRVVPAAEGVVSTIETS